MTTTEFQSHPILQKAELLLTRINEQEVKDKLKLYKIDFFKTACQFLTDGIKEWLHGLGNLALIDNNKNASLSNKLFKEKNVKYQGAIETRANTNFLFITNHEWNIEAIQNNHKRTVTLLIQYYEGNNLKTFQQIKKNLNSTISL